MLSLLADYERYFGPLRLLRYISVRTILAAATALVIGFVIGPMLIRKFRELKFGHGYIDDRTGALGTTYFDKQHTPTMGGLIIFLSVFVSAALWAAPNVWVFVALFVLSLIFGALPRGEGVAAGGNGFALIALIAVIAIFSYAWVKNDMSAERLGASIDHTVAQVADNTSTALDHAGNSADHVVNDTSNSIKRHTDGNPHN